MNIVFLDCAVINPGDCSWSSFEHLGQFTEYEHSTYEEGLVRARDADALIVDSFDVDRWLMEECPNLIYIGPAATGYNHIDVEAAKELGIAVANVPAYSTDAVAQHAIALLLDVTNRIRQYDGEVKAGGWGKTPAAGAEDEKMDHSITLLNGKSIGIIGYGNIGKQVGRIAEALGMTVYPYSADPDKAVKADVVSLNCPLTDENTNMVDAGFISNMKDGAILINTARGGLIDEQALCAALRSGKLAGAGLDVMAKEPPEDTNPLFGLDNCVITPHIAFTPRETRQKVIDICAENLRSFIEGGDLNRIV